MPSFNDLNDLVHALSTDGHSLSSQQKQNLVGLLKVALKVEGEQSLEEALAALREGIKNALKTDDAIKIAAVNELEDEIKQEVNNLEQLNKEKTNLQTQLDAVKKEKQELQTKFVSQVKELEERLAAKNTEVQKLQKENRELGARKQPTEQPRLRKVPTNTAAVGVGLAAGLAAFIALEYIGKLEMLMKVGIAVTSALTLGGGAYLALKPSTQMSETQKPQKANNVDAEGCYKAKAVY